MNHLTQGNGCVHKYVQLMMGLRAVKTGPARSPLHQPWEEEVK